MARVINWPDVLAAEIEAARVQAYVLGTHDCLRFTCRCIDAMTGVDYWPRFAGYTTRREALRTIAKIAPTLAGAVDIVLGQAMRPAPFAHRGDVVLFHDAAGDHLGVCVGLKAAVLGEAGLAFVRLDHPGVVGCWRVE